MKPSVQHPKIITAFAHNLETFCTHPNFHQRLCALVIAFSSLAFLEHAGSIANRSCPAHILPRMLFPLVPVSKLCRARRLLASFSEALRSRGEDLPGGRWCACHARVLSSWVLLLQNRKKAQRLGLDSEEDHNRNPSSTFGFGLLDLSGDP